MKFSRYNSISRNGAHALEVASQLPLVESLPQFRLTECFATSATSAFFNAFVTV